VGPIARWRQKMIIDKESLIEDVKNLIDLPILGKSLYFRIEEYKAALSSCIEEFTDIVELRNLVKTKADKWPKTSDDHVFEIVNINGIWIPVLPGEKDIEPSWLLPGKLVNYLVKEAANMDYGIIKRKNNLTLPGVKGQVFNMWFEKIRDDYIYGIIKTTIMKRPPKYSIDIDDALKELKNIDFDKIFEIFRLIFEEEEFRKDVYKVYRIWNNILVENPQSNPGIPTE